MAHILAYENQQARGRYIANTASLSLQEYLGREQRYDSVRLQQELGWTCRYPLPSANDIAARAGVSKGVIYHYFDSREEIFLTLHLQLSAIGSARSKLGATGTRAGA